jgi:pyrimidine-nucleoside phosphorylase
MSRYLPTELIQKKKRGQAHSRDELAFLIQGFLDGAIPDYQMPAWLMAVFFRGLSQTELLELTILMRDSGRRFDFKSRGLFTVDKHSTGGVGDKTSLLVAPLVAACGGFVPMMAGRGLGHTGGTVDKLESLIGFNSAPAPEEFARQVQDIGLAIIGQTADICPADKRLYALRDVTATIDCIELISASIMSKKLAAGVQGLCMDVKYGSGAFMRSLTDATALAEQLVAVGDRSGVRVHAVISSMNQPLGRYAGNSLEVGECLDILAGRRCIENGHDFYQDTRDLSVFLAAQMLVIAGLVESASQGLERVRSALESGAALKKFQAMCGRQGVRDWEMPKPQAHLVVTSQRRGFVQGLDTEAIGFCLVRLGAGREKQGVELDLSAGIENHFRIGDAIQEGQTLWTLHGRDRPRLESVADRLRETIAWSESPVARDALIVKVIEGH